jgi:hypothetical protein
MNGQIFEGIQNFRYLGVLINLKNFISDEIKSRIAVFTVEGKYLGIQP